MAAVCVHVPTIGALKLALKELFPSVKSSHMSEAIAYSLGFQTYAAMRTKLITEMPIQAAVLHNGWFVQRLVEFGYPVPEPFSFESVALPPSSPAASLLADLESTSLCALGAANFDLYHACRSLQELGAKLPTFISVKSVLPHLELHGMTDGGYVRLNLRDYTRHQAELVATFKAIGGAAKDIEISMSDVEAFLPRKRLAVEDPAKR